MTEILRERISDYFTEYPVLCGEAVPLHEIAELEAWVGFELPQSYKEFVRHFGGGRLGELPICGLRGAKAMNKRDSSAKEKTQFFRMQNWPETREWLVISSDLGGNPIGIDRDGRVYTFDHDFGGRRIVAETFDAFLEQQLLK